MGEKRRTTNSCEILFLKWPHGISRYLDKNDGLLSNYSIDSDYNRLGNQRNSINWEILDIDINFIPTIDVSSYLDTTKVSLTLKTINIPISLINNQNGGDITQYSSLFLSLENTISNNSNLFATNNPNIKNSMFKISIDNLSNIQDIEFATFTAVQNQSVVLDINNDMHFKLYFADGKPVEFTQTDNNYPSMTDDKLQINALFEIKLHTV